MYNIDKNFFFIKNDQFWQFLKKRQVFGNYFEKNKFFCIFDIQMAIYRRVRWVGLAPKDETDLEVLHGAGGDGPVCGCPGGRRGRCLLRLVDQGAKLVQRVLNVASLILVVKFLSNLMNP